MVLPSKAATFARFKSREIHRQERHAINSALHQHPPDEEWEDGPYYRNVNSAESYSRHEMPYRVMERRSADNLSGLQRWVEHHQREAKGDDQKAYEKCAEVIQPGKNLICKHAMEHAAAWLDVPNGRRYFLPEENERDAAAREAAMRKRMTENYGPVVISEAELLDVLQKLYSTQHGKLNKILKKHNLMKRSCTTDDPCTSESHRKVKHYFIYEPSHWQKWRRVAMFEWSDAMKLGKRTQVRDVMEKQVNHDIQKCENRMIIRGPADLEPLYHRLNHESYRRSKGSKPATVSYGYGHWNERAIDVFTDIMKLAEQAGLR